jgi:hypothetical protein
LFFRYAARCCITSAVFFGTRSAVTLSYPNVGMRCRMLDVFKLATSTFDHFGRSCRTARLRPGGVFRLRASLSPFRLAHMAEHAMRVCPVELLLPPLPFVLLPHGSFIGRMGGLVLLGKQICRGVAVTAATAIVANTLGMKRIGASPAVRAIL